MSGVTDESPLTTSAQDSNARRGLTRRQFLKLTAGGLLAAVGGTTAFLALNNEATDLTVEHVQIPIGGLGSALEGFTIAQISDIHLQPYTRPDFVAQAVAATNALNPDLIVLTGDYVWHDIGAAFELAPIIARLNARHGVFAVLGNHDYWLDVDAVKASFVQAGIPMLINQGVAIAQGRDQFYLGGMDDGWSGQPDLDATLADAPPGAPVVLLLHEPDLIEAVSRDGRVQLQLAGHTHGGQVRIRGEALVLPYLGQMYDMGLYRVRESWVYTNRGLGMISVPARYNCPPEITLFTLVGA
ncbi:MAG: metallophosphoesterase [Caldilineales bacterium]|nr:metallophosphoesterase [Caldilineales bacterium]